MRLEGKSAGKSAVLVPEEGGDRAKGQTGAFTRGERCEHAGGSVRLEEVRGGIALQLDPPADLLAH